MVMFLCELAIVAFTIGVGVLVRLGCVFLIGVFCFYASRGHMGRGFKSSINRGVSFTGHRRVVSLLFFIIPWLIVF